MNKLPYINDPIYTELKEVKDSELTNRIAYECAIRNEKVIELKNDIKKLIGQIREKLIIAIAIEWNRFNDTKLIDKLIKSQFILIKDISTRLIHIYQKGYLLPSFKKFIEEQEETKLIKEKNKILLEEYWIREYYEEDIVEYIFSDNEFVYHVTEPYNILTSNFTIGKIRTYITKFHQELGIIDKKDKLFPLPQNIEDYNKPYNKNVDYSIYSISESNKQIDLDKLNLLISIKRLIIPKELDPCINISINPYHIKDIEEHFKIILKTIKNNKSICRVSKEIDLIEKFSKEVKRNKKIFTKKNIAEMFFVYDFFISLEKRINIINEKKRYKNKFISRKNSENWKIQEIDRTIEFIKNQPRDSYTTEEINKLIEEQKEEKLPLKKLLDNPTTNKTTKNYAFNMNSFKKYSNKKILSNTAYNYYYTPKPYIEELKYKELVSGLIEP